MGVISGYKESDVGVIPQNWDGPRLDSLGDGRIPPIKAGPFGSALTKDQYVAQGYKVYGQEQVISGDHRFGDYFVTEGKYRQLASCAVRPGDVLLSLVGTAGRLLVVPDDAAPGIINPRLLRFSFDRSRVSPAFFKYAFEADRVQLALSRLAQGGTMGVLNAGALRSFRIALPDIQEQLAIEAVLCDMDRVLAGLDCLIAKKRDVKQAAMQQIPMGQTRLPGFHGEWQVKQLAEVSEVKTGPFGSALHESDYVDAGTPIITVEHLGEFGVEHFNLPLVSGRDRKRLHAYSLVEGDIVFSRVGSVDRNALIRAPESGWLFSGRLLRVRLNARRVYAPFMSYQFRSESFRRSVLAVAVGQTMASLNTRILAGLMVLLPSRAEQMAIAEVLSDMDAELCALVARRSKTLALKQAMMQELLTGRTRLV